VSAHLWFANLLTASAIGWQVSRVPLSLTTCDTCD